MSIAITIEARRALEHIEWLEKHGWSVSNAAEVIDYSTQIRLSTVAAGPIYVTIEAAHSKELVTPPKGPPPPCTMSLPEPLPADYVDTWTQ